LALLAFGLYAKFKSFSAAGQMVAGQGIKHYRIMVKLLFVLTLLAVRLFGRCEKGLYQDWPPLCSVG
jgi:hypothetical protein